MDKKSVFSSPFFAVYFIALALIIYYFVSYCFTFKYGFFDIEEVGITEVLTYLFYGVGLGIAVCFGKTLLNSPNRQNYCEIIFLWFAALMREMGIQHWLTSHDTVVTKIRFFTSPTNPLYEKLTAAFLMLLVLFVLLSLIIRNFKFLLKSISEISPVGITILTFLILAVLTQIADRTPAIYFKEHGAALSQHILFVLKIFEEGGESMLPLLFGIGMYQYCNK